MSLLRYAIIDPDGENVTSTIGEEVNSLKLEHTESLKRNNNKY